MTEVVTAGESSSPAGGLGADFTRLWAAYTASTLGSAVATDAFMLIAVQVLAAKAFQVSLLAALGGAVGGLLALPFGSWIEFRRKRPVMIAADLMRCGVLVTVPVAYAAGALTYLHLAVVCVLVAVGQIVFAGASGSHVKSLVPRGHFTEANGRFESVLWTSQAVGPPVGGLMMSALGPAATVVTDAVSYLLSAIGIRSIAGREVDPPARRSDHRWWRGLGAGARHIRSDRVLRLLYLNTVTVGALIMAIAPVWAVVMLRELRFGTFEYGLSVGVPCLAGLLGSRLGRRLVPRHGQRAVLLTAGVARVMWLPLLPFVGPGPLGLAMVTGIHAGTVFFMSLFNPVMAACRLERTPDDKVARVLITWSITNNVTRAVCILAWGVLATFTTPRSAIMAAAVLLLGSCVCLPWRGGLSPRRPP